MRTAEIKRTTKETDIHLRLCLDGSGSADVSTGCGFLDHMLTLFAHHGRFDLFLRCTGDVQVDYHHTTEDIGIALGEAFRTALGSKAGINRYGSFLLPMDESLVLCALDLSGRAHLSYDAAVPAEKVGDFDTELAEEFWLGFVRAAAATLHIRQLAGKNSHHILEAIFKGTARALRIAVTIAPENGGTIPSTKGLL